MTFRKKKLSGGHLGIQLSAGMMAGVLIAALFYKPFRYESVLCISQIVAERAADVAGFRMASGYGLEAENMVMQVAYQLARRSVVKVIVKDFTGNGIIWKIDDEIIIVSNKHLLGKDVKAEIIFCNGETFSADIVGYSQQYDIGFARISEAMVSNSVLREIYEAVPVLYEVDSEDKREMFVQDWTGKRILQTGAAAGQRAADFSLGTIRGLQFVPLFNTMVLETDCFSKAGMSGGGVFGEDGRLLGMISGGDVLENAKQREAEVTYSIPPVLIATEYEILMQDKQ
jgi:S1-C subfamily serine protease